MKADKHRQKDEIIELDEAAFDLEFDELYSKLQESNRKTGSARSKALHRRRTRRRLYQLEERKWIKRNCWFDDESLYDFADHEIR